ncbi:SpoIIE family protein phosphatase [Streptomyces sp. NPDC055815]
MPEPVAVTDEHGVVIRFSRSGERLLGPDVAAVGRPLMDLLAVIDFDALDQGLTIAPAPPDEPDARWALWPSGPLPGGVREGVLEAMFTRSHFGLHVIGTDLRVLRVNSRAVGMRGVPESEIVGRPFLEVYARYAPPGRAPDDRFVREVLETGTPVIDRLVRGRPLSDPNREHVFSVSVFRLEDDGGRTLGAVAATVDVTDRERARQRLSVLHRAHERIGRSLDARSCAYDLVESAVPLLADAAAVALADAVLRGPAAGDVAPHGAHPELRCTAAWPPGATAVPAVGEAVRAETYTRTPARLDPHLEGASTDCPTLVAPLVYRGTQLGLALFRRPDRTEPFDAEDLHLAANLAAYTALCIDNARRYEHAHAVALALQGHLLRPAPTPQSVVRTFHRYLPTGRGAGAWLDTMPLSGARVALTVGQVYGQGPEATAAMVQLRSAVFALSSLDLDPHELLARLNETARRLNEERTATGGNPLKAGCVYAVHSPVTQECSVARAGAVRLMIGQPDGTWEETVHQDAPALGADSPPFTTDEFILPTASTLVLLSGDPAPVDETLHRLRELLADDADIATQDALDSLTYDQAAVLVARIGALDPEDVASWDISAEPEAVADARRGAVRRLEEWGLPDLAFATELIVSELVTNAIRYGRPPVRLRLVRDTCRRTLTCEVSDASAAAPHLRHARAGDEGGRGLFLCGEVSDQWGVRWSGGGKTVWTESGFGS